MDQRLRDQLNKIERFAKEAEPYVLGTVLHVRADKLEAMWRLLDSSLFREGGYYYDLRRENERLKQASEDILNAVQSLRVAIAKVTVTILDHRKEHESP